jgi:hypothetical protein
MAPVTANDLGHSGIGHADPARSHDDAGKRSYKNGRGATRER